MSIGIQGKVTVSRNLERFKDLPGKSIEKGMKYIAQVLPKRSKQRLSALGYIKTGKTLASIKGRSQKEKAIIGAGEAGARQAVILEYGAKPKPHLIRPKLQKGLFWPGAAHPAKVVRHPGSRIKAGMFLRGPVNEMQNSTEMASVFSKAIAELREKVT